MPICPNNKIKSLLLRKKGRLDTGRQIASSHSYRVLRLSAISLPPLQYSFTSLGRRYGSECRSVTVSWVRKRNCWKPVPKQQSSLRLFSICNTALIIPHLLCLKHFWLPSLIFVQWQLAPLYFLKEGDWYSWVKSKAGGWGLLKRGYIFLPFRI